MNILSDRSLPTPRVASRPFTEADWKEILGHLTSVLGSEAQRYASNPAAKLFAAIPYLAGSEDPDRFSLSNLLTFHGATKARALFNHRKSDDADILRRLATYHTGSLADPQVVSYGLNLLALISLGDHEEDRQTDVAAGKYNPVASGAWDAKVLRAELTRQMDQDPVLKEQFFQAVGMDISTLSWWSGEAS